MSTAVVGSSESLAASLAAIAAGDRTVLAQAISRAENSPALAGLIDSQLAAAGQRALRIGLTGPPGAGKSTLLGAVVPEFVRRNHTVGVLLIDPSSARTGGAVLADRVRMKHRPHPRLYVRSIGSRLGHGGLAEVTATAIRLLEHWGADVVLIETVGAGQSDIDVCGLADVTMVSAPPGLGDEMQVMKAGLMEVADIFVVTKSDRPGAQALAAGLADAGPGGRTGTDRPVLLTSATNGDGIAGLVDLLERQEPTPVGGTPTETAPLSSAGQLGQPKSAPVAAPRPVPAVRPSAQALTPFDLTGRVAIVTGATSGLGRRFAEVLHAAGASVVLTGRRADRLNELTATLERSIAVAGDITRAGDRESVIAATLKRLGRIDVLINNAGVSGDPVPAEHLPAERWTTTIDVNLSSVFSMAQLVATPMLAQAHGSIVNITSVFGLVANAPVMDAAYAASKAGLVNLTRELAVEWAKRGVRVNAIAPGWFPSEMTADMVDDASSQRYIRRSCPMERMGREDELDGVLLFLASDASSYCTGQTIAVDGGWTAR